MSGTTMDLWRLERVRLLRTNRLVMLLGLYVFFGVAGPLTARYQREILERVGGGELGTIDLPPATPPDALTQFTSNASQLGLLAIVIVAAGALTLDAKPEFGAFLRTRARSVGALLVPRLVTVSGAAALALVLGTAIAALVTGALLGRLGAVPLVAGTLYGALYLVFVVCLTAAVASRTSSVLTTVLVTVAMLVALPLLSLVGPIERFVPSELVGAVDGLVRGLPLTEPLPAAVVAAAAAAGLAALAVRGNREPEL